MKYYIVFYTYFDKIQSEPYKTEKGYLSKHAFFGHLSNVTVILDLDSTDITNFIEVSKEQYDNW